MSYTNVLAEDVLGPDNGIDENGTTVISPTLALRCGLSSQNTQMTKDCIDRLAYDAKKGEVLEGFGFKDYEEERKAIIRDYAKAYIEEALKHLVENSQYEDTINKKMCIDKTAEGCSAVSNDTRAEMEYNNKIAAMIAVKMINALKMRSMEGSIDSISYVLDTYVSETEVDLDDKSLAGPPK